MAIKLCGEFIMLIINICKKKKIKEYNEQVKNSKYINKNFSYLMDTCCKRYFELSKEEYSKIKKFTDNNIDTFESILAPIHNLLDIYKKVYNSYCYYPSNYYCIKDYKKCICITGKYNEFCEKNNYILKKIPVSYFNVEYINFFYLLQKVTKLGISNINSHILINMFINLYDNSNIDCNEKVKSKIYDLYQHYVRIII